MTSSMLGSPCPFSGGPPPPPSPLTTLGGALVQDAAAYSSSRSNDSSSLSGEENSNRNIIGRSASRTVSYEQPSFTQKDGSDKSINRSSSWNPTPDLNVPEYHHQDASFFGTGSFFDKARPGGGTDLSLEEAE